MTQTPPKVPSQIGRPLPAGSGVQNTPAQDLLRPGNADWQLRNLARQTTGNPVANVQRQATRRNIP